MQRLDGLEQKLDQCLHYLQTYKDELKKKSYPVGTLKDMSSQLNVTMPDITDDFVKDNEFFKKIKKLKARFIQHIPPIDTVPQQQTSAARQ